MASLKWTWNDFWNWFIQLETQEEKTVAMKELLGDGWLKNLTAQTQAEVMMDAPMEILQAMKHAPNIFKHETIVLIDYSLRIKNKKGKRR